MQLLLLHPEVPTCEDCRKWLYKDDWSISMRAGQQVPRPRGSPLPCVNCPKSGKHNKPNPTAELTGRNGAAYELWLAARAGLDVPDLPVVYRDLVLIQGVVERVERMERQRADVARLFPLLTKK